MIIHVFISSRIDYCSALFSSLGNSALNHLQAIWNAAARLLTRSNRRSHITPVLKSLHWLPVTYRVQFKILIITYQSLHSEAPAYISDLIHPYQSVWPLWSDAPNLLAVSLTHFKTRGDQVFEAVAPKWTALPIATVTCIHWLYLSYFGVLLIFSVSHFATTMQFFTFNCMTHVVILSFLLYYFYCTVSLLFLCFPVLILLLL